MPTSKRLKATTRWGQAQTGLPYLTVLRALRRWTYHLVPTGLGDGEITIGTDTQAVTTGQASANGCVCVYYSSDQDAYAIFFPTADWNPAHQSWGDAWLAEPGYIIAVASATATLEIDHTRQLHIGTGHAHTLLTLDAPGTYQLAVADLGRSREPHHWHHGNAVVLTPAGTDLAIRTGDGPAPYPAPPRPQQAALTLASTRPPWRRSPQPAAEAVSVEQATEHLNKLAAFLSSPEMIARDWQRLERRGPHGAGAVGTRLEIPSISAHLGRTGEGWVLELERARVAARLGPKYAQLVRYVGHRINAYDIESVELHGGQLRKRYLEVKTTLGGLDAPFRLSVAQRAAAVEHGEQYVLVRVIGMLDRPDLIAVSGDPDTYSELLGEQRRLVAA
jgi:hypothetical protein